MRDGARALAIAILLLTAGCGTTAVSRASPTPVPASSPVWRSPSPPAPSPSPPAATPSPGPERSPASPPSPSPAPPGFFLPPYMVGAELYRLPTDRHIVALTFDAGAGAQGLPKILAALGAAGVPGTFFLTGRWVESNPDGARQIAAVEMDSIGNHSYDHPYMTHLSVAQMQSEVQRAEDLIRSATGRDPRPLFRFPYGDSNPQTVSVINGMLYGSVRWTVDTLGWEGASAGQSVQSVHDRVLAGLQPGEIVLMHIGAANDGTTLDADALPSVIRDIQARGYGFVAVWDFVEGLA